MSIVNRDIYSRTKDFIKKNDLVLKGEKILLCLSAGKDSMALLDIFLFIKDEMNLEIAVFHLNNLIRGEESEMDEKFLVKLANEKQVKIYVHRFDFTKERSKSSFEEFARQKRYEIADRISLQGGFDRIATAHNRDDNIETIVMRLFSGTGIHGLSGIGIKRDNIIRPILFLSTDEIYRHLKEKQIQWREDSSNLENIYLRNFTRNRLLPLIYENFSGADRAILSLAEISGEYVSIIDDLIHIKYGDIYWKEGDNLYIEFEKYIHEKKIFKYVIYKAIRENFNHFISKNMLEEIYKRAIINKTNLTLYDNKNFRVQKTYINNKKVIVISTINGYHKGYKGQWKHKIDLTDNSEKRIILDEIDVEIDLRIADFSFFIDNYKDRNWIFIALNNKVNYIIIRNIEKSRVDPWRLYRSSRRT